MKRIHLPLLFIAVLFSSFSYAQDFASNGSTQPVLDGTKKNERKVETGKDRKGHLESEVEPIEVLVWNLYFKGMNSNVAITSDGKQDSHVNYLIGNDASKHQINVPDFKVVNYNNVYNNI